MAAEPLAQTALVLKVLEQEHVAIKALAVLMALSRRTGLPRSHFPGDLS